MQALIAGHKEFHPAFPGGFIRHLPPLRGPWCGRRELAHEEWGCFSPGKKWTRSQAGSPIIRSRLMCRSVVHLPLCSSRANRPKRPPPQRQKSILSRNSSCWSDLLLYVMKFQIITSQMGYVTYHMTSTYVTRIRNETLAMQGQVKKEM